MLTISQLYTNFTQKWLTFHAHASFLSFTSTLLSRAASSSICLKAFSFFSLNSEALKRKYKWTRYKMNTLNLTRSETQSTSELADVSLVTSMCLYWCKRDYNEWVILTKKTSALIDFRTEGRFVNFDVWMSKTWNSWLGDDCHNHLAMHLDQNNASVQLAIRAATKNGMLLLLFSVHEISICSFHKQLMIVQNLNNSPKIG